MKYFSYTRLYLMLCILIAYNNYCATAPCSPCVFTGSVAQFCNANIQNHLCVGGDAQIGNDLLVCGQIIASGFQGVTGVTGPQGPTGPAGGPVGPTGNTGATGPCCTGVTGATGATGPQGATGGGLIIITGPGGTTNIIPSTGPSTSCTNGALVVEGGVGIGGNLNVCGTGHFFSTGQSTSCTNGALVVDGGVGIGGNLNVCGTITASGFSGGGITVSGIRGNTGATGPCCTGPTGATGAAGATGAIVSNQNYLFSFATGTQTIAPTPINTYKDIIFESDPEISGWVHTPGTATFTALATGKYLIQYSAQVEATGGSGAIVMRAVLNGTEIMGSQLYSDIQSSSITQLGARFFLVDVNAGDVLKIQFASNDSSARLIAGDIPTNPGGISTTPTSVELVVTRIA